jgi:isoquinoline 1-oxidoreductase subunit beta
MKSPSTLSRRDFLARLSSGGLSLGIMLQGSTLLASTQQINRAAISGDDLPWQPDLFLSLAADGKLTIWAHRSEMGTGIGTSLPMVLADEMAANWQRVEVVQAIGNRDYGSQNTDGSRSMRHFFDRMRQAGAIARQMLLTAAAQLWKVPVGECDARSHFVYHDASGRKIGFGDLAQAASALPIPEAAQVALLPASKRRYIGRGVPNRDMQAILNGAAIFGADVRLPDMRFASIERSPVLGGKALKWNAAAAMKVPGVEKVVELPAASPPFAFKALGGIAVIASDSWSAMQGRQKLAVQWHDGEHAEFSTAQRDRERQSAAQKKGVVMREQGDFEKAMSKLGQVVMAEYSLPHLAHVPMETPCATARIDGDACEIWAPTQTPQSAQRSVAQALGIPLKQVTVHVTLLGGGFGRKSKPDYIVEAALLARELGAPVQVLWTREDDIHHDYFHAASAMHMQAWIDPKGQAQACLMRSAFTPIGSTFNPATKNGSAGEVGQGFTDLPFNIPNLRIENCAAESDLRIGWLRSVCNIFHGFGVNCFADEMAAAARHDPLFYMLNLIGPDRHIDLPALGVKYSNYGSPLDTYPVDTARLKNVLRVAAEKAGWSRRELPPHHAMGLAVHRSFCGYVAWVVEVKVTLEGQLSIPNAFGAIDCGLAVDPDRVIAQMEGSAVFGTSLALSGEITAEHGRVLQNNFDGFPIARMHEAPRNIQVEIVPSTEPPSGVGETGVPPFAPALANAVFAATDKRIRTLPFSHHDLSHSKISPNARHRQILPFRETP